MTDYAYKATNFLESVHNFDPCFFDQDLSVEGIITNQVARFINPTQADLDSHVKFEDWAEHFDNDDADKWSKNVEFRAEVLKQVKEYLFFHNLKTPIEIHKYLTAVLNNEIEVDDNLLYKLHVFYNDNHNRSAMNGYIQGAISNIKMDCSKGKGASKRCLIKHEDLFSNTPRIANK